MRCDVMKLTWRCREGRGKAEGLLTRYERRRPKAAVPERCLVILH